MCDAQLLTSVQLHILVSSNPDGNAHAEAGHCDSQQPGTRNSRLVDLDTNFSGLLSHIVCVALAVTKQYNSNLSLQAHQNSTFRVVFTVVMIMIAFIERTVHFVLC